MLPGFRVRRGTKLRENNLRVKHYEMHTINSNKAIGLYTFFLGRATERPISKFVPF